MGEANLYALFERRAPRDRDAPCFILPGGDTISYGRLGDGVSRVAGLLRARGVVSGDRVLVDRIDKRAVYVKNRRFDHPRPATTEGE